MALPFLQRKRRKAPGFIREECVNFGFSLVSFPPPLKCRRKTTERMPFVVVSGIHLFLVHPFWCDTPTP